MHYLHSPPIAAPTQPEGEELNTSERTLQTNRSMVSQPPERNGLFSHLPSPDPRLGSIQTSSDDVEEIKNEAPIMFRIPSVGVSESSGVEDHVIKIQVVDEDEEEEINEESGLLLRRDHGGFHLELCLQMCNV